MRAQIQELSEFLRIPSISTLPDYASAVEQAAQWVVDRLRRAGLSTVQLHRTSRHPMIYAAWTELRGAPTVLVYGHYDVQPPDPLERWDTPPFEPSIRDGRIYARGASDDKAPLLTSIKAVEELLAARQLPINVKFLFEGEEEIGSPGLRGFVKDHVRLLAADLVVSADGAMWRASEPSLIIGSRGLSALQVDLATANRDLHSGRYGGAVPNPLHDLASLIAGLHDAEGRVTVRGFYDNVRELSPAERDGLVRLTFDDAVFQHELGLPALAGERGYSTLERLWTRPTLDCTGVWGGFTGDGVKTVIAAEAHAKITCRLVPDQTPDEIVRLVEAHLRHHAPPTCRIAIRQFPGSARPYEISRGNPALAIAAAVLEEVMGIPPVTVRIGGTLPAAEIFQTELGLDTLFFCFAVSDEQYHAPNEFFRLDRLGLGRRAWITLLTQLGGADLAARSRPTGEAW